MKRVQVADLQRVLLEPQARPVDAFERAGGVDPSQGLTSLAQSLSSIQPSINRVLQSRDKRAEEEAILRAQRDRMKYQMSFADGVREGVISEGENPYYVKEYKRKDGEITGRQVYLQKVSQAYEQSGLAYQNFNSEGERQEALANFLQTQREEFLADKDDIYWVDGAKDGISQTEAQFTQRYMQDVATVNTERATETQMKVIGEMLHANAPIEARGQAIAQFIQDNQGQFGISYSKLNETVIDSVKVESERLARLGRYDEALAITESLNHVPTRSGVLGQTGAGKDARNEIVANIQKIQRQEDDYEWSLESREYARENQEWQRIARGRTMQEWKSENTLGAAHVWIAQNPTGDFEAFAKELTDKDPKMGKYIPSLRSAFHSRVKADEVVFENQGYVGALRLEVQQNLPGTMEKLHDALVNKEIGRTTFMQLMDDLARKSTADSRIKALDTETQSLIKDQKKWMTDYVKATGAIAPGLFKADTIEKARQVDFMIDTAVVQFLDKNPNASFMEVSEEVSKIIDRLKKHPIFENSKSSANVVSRPQLPPEGGAANPFDNM